MQMHTRKRRKNMKAKTRILAMLLTALMVVGLLPLSLFAAGESLSDPVNAAVTGNKSWESVNATLKAQGIDAYTYQNFENIPDSMFTDGVMDLPAEHRGGWVGIPKDGEQMVATGVNYTAANYYPFETKNQKDAFSIKKESDGNKALFLGTGVRPASNDDNWFDIEGFTIGQGNDILVSLDFKMGGDQVGAANSFITFITRQATKPDGSMADLGRTDVNLASLTRDGGIILYDGGAATEIVGYLSKDKYTNLTVETDLMNNKYYFYIDGVLVTPNGLQFMSDSLITTIQGKANENYQPSRFKLAEARIYTISDNTNEHYHQGMYMDNILLAGRSMLATGNSRNLDLYTMDLSLLPEEAIGKSVADYDGKKIPGTVASGLGLPYINGASAQTAKDSIIYFKETDGSISIKYQKAAAAKDGDQVYTQFHISDLKKVNAGQNIVFKGSYKAGSETIAGGDILDLIDRTNGRCDVVTIAIGGDRILRVMGDKTSSIAQFPVGEFVDIEVILVCNVANGRPLVKVYLNGEIAYTREIRENLTNMYNGKTAEGQVLTATTPIIQDVHMPAFYKDKHYDFAADDLHIQDLYVGYTNAYNTAASGRFNPFANTSTGFVKAGTFNRYIENGVIKVRK